MAGKCTTLEITNEELAAEIATLAAAVVLVNDIRAKLKGSFIVSLPGLAIGDGSKLAVASLAVDYLVNGIRYTLAADTTGVTLGTTVVPVSTFGAVALDAPVSGGTVVPIEAPANATGYASAALAVAALPAPAAGKCRLGWVTVSGDTAGAAAFTLGTTALDAANTTVAYTDAETVYEEIGAAVS